MKLNGVKQSSFTNAACEHSKKSAQHTSHVVEPFQQDAYPWRNTKGLSTLTLGTLPRSAPGVFSRVSSRA